MLAQHRVLVLNKLWTAVAIASLEDAIKLLFKTEDAAPHKGEVKARIVDPLQNYQTYSWEDWAEITPEEGDAVIRGIHREYKVPEVIVLTRFDEFPEHRINFSRRTIYRRDNYRCQYCNRKPGSENLTIDHVIPKSHGGGTTWTNCVLACVDCNSRKANRTPKQAGMKLLSTPKKPRFNLFPVDRTRMPESWEKFVSEAYWNTTLENDN